MSDVGDQQRMVAEAAWDFLYMEVVSAQRRLFNSETDSEAAYTKMELLGYRVGLSMAERASKDRARFADTLDIIKFVCKEMWILIFKKQVDNLKTNNRGVYVITDNSFRLLSRMASDSLSGDAAKTVVNDHLGFACGLIRGALANFGITAIVAAETATLPQYPMQQAD
eukprot:jgi/Hompol1/5858/HPOL_001112-RA